MPVRRQSAGINRHEAFQARLTSKDDDGGAQARTARPPEGGCRGTPLPDRLQELGQRRDRRPVHERNSREPIHRQTLPVPCSCAIAGIGGQDHDRAGVVDINPLNPLLERAGACGQIVLQKKSARSVHDRACVHFRPVPRFGAGPCLEFERLTKRPVVDERRDSVVAEPEQLAASEQPSALLFWIIYSRHFEPHGARPGEIEREPAGTSRRRHEPIC